MKVNVGDGKSWVWVRVRVCETIGIIVISEVLEKNWVGVTVRLSCDEG